MTRALLTNNASTTLSVAISSTGATTFTVTSAAGFPAPTGVQYFYCTLLDSAAIPEIVKVTNVTGNVFTCVRAQDGTAARTFPIDASVRINLTAAVLAELWNEDSIHNATALTTPVDADELAILDSATTFSIKKVTWANIKATLASLYATAAQGTLATNALPSASFTDAAVSGKLITGYVSGAGTVANTDTILAAIQKLNGNVAGKQASGTYATGTGSASGVNTGDQTIPTTLPASDVSAWAKAGTKPTYTYTEVGAQVAGSYAPATSGSSIQYGNGSGGFSSVTIGAGLTFSAGTLATTAVVPGYEQTFLLMGA